MASSSCHRKVPSFTRARCGRLPTPSAGRVAGPSPLLFCTFYDHPFHKPTDENVHHDDGWLSISTRSCQSVHVGIFRLNLGQGARVRILLSLSVLLACYRCIRIMVSYLDMTSIPNLLQPSSDRTIGIYLRAQTNRESVTRARVRWWRTLEYWILVVTMDQSDMICARFRLQCE